MMKPHFAALCAPRYVSPLAAPAAALGVNDHEHQPPYSGLNVIENPNNPNHFIFTRERQHENATF